MTAFNYFLKSAGLGMSIAFLWVFIDLWRYSSLLVREPNKAILYAEIALMVFLGVSFIVSMIIDLNHKFPKRMTREQKAQKAKEIRASGASYSEIAQALGVSKGTVSNYLRWKAK